MKLNVLKNGHARQFVAAVYMSEIASAYPELVKHVNKLTAYKVGKNGGKMHKYRKLSSFSVLQSVGE